MSHNILIVEDDPNLGEILHEYLQIKGFTTTLCRDGVEGESALESQSFDLVSASMRLRLSTDIRHRKSRTVG